MSDNRSFMVMDVAGAEATLISAADEIEAIEQFIRQGEPAKDGDEFLIIGIDEMHKVTAQVKLLMRRRVK